MCFPIREIWCIRVPEPWQISWKYLSPFWKKADGEDVRSFTIKYIFDWGNNIRRIRHVWTLAFFCLENLDTKLTNTQQLKHLDGKPITKCVEMEDDDPSHRNLLQHFACGQKQDLTERRSQQPHFPFLPDKPKGMVTIFISRGGTSRNLRWQRCIGTSMRRTSWRCTQAVASCNYLGGVLPPCSSQRILWIRC